MMKIKICGIRRSEDVDAVNLFHPDYIGFIFAPTWRQISLDTALALAKKTDASIKKVGVFVNQPIELLAETYASGAVDFLQLHGQEDEAYEKELARTMKAKGVKNPEETWIRAYRIRGPGDFDQIGNTRSATLLLDAFSEDALGGTGQSFDWSLIRNVEKPFFLAGGITADNVGKAMETIHPFGIDASSSLETNRVKDPEKIKILIERIRSYE